MKRAFRRRGFSLLEMLVSLALLGILMVALNTFLFSMSELWGGGRDQRLFDQHARAAAAMVRKAFASAALGPGASGVTLRDVEDGAGGTAPRLGFLLPDAGRLADWPEAPLPDVDFEVVAEEGRGLVFRWRSRLELERAPEDRHETVISPFVTALRFEYYDPELRVWTIADEPVREPGATTWRRPARIHLVFRRGALQATKIIDLPLKRAGASAP